MIYRGIFGHCEYSGKRVKRYFISNVKDIKNKEVSSHIWIDRETVPELQKKFKYGDTIEFWAAKVVNKDTGTKLAGFRDFRKLNVGEGGDE